MQALFALRAGAQQIDNALNDWLADTVGSFARFQILMALWTRKGHEIPHTDIVNAMSVTRATVSNLIAALERDGLVKSYSDTEDRRKLIARTHGQGRDDDQKSVRDKPRTLPGSLHVPLSGRTNPADHTVAPYPCRVCDAPTRIDGLTSPARESKPTPAAVPEEDARGRRRPDPLARGMGGRDRADAAGPHGGRAVAIFEEWCRPHPEIAKRGCVESPRHAGAVSSRITVRVSDQSGKKAICLLKYR